MGVRFTEKRSVLFLIFALCLATALLSFGTVFYSAEVSGQDKEKAETAPSALGKIAYAMRYSGPVAPQGLLYIANADGTNPTEIGTSPVIAPSQPAWNAAGTKLLFVDTQAPYDIHVINIDGTQRTNLTNTDASIAERNPSWSSNGKIAYERADQIWVMNSDGSGQTAFPGLTRIGPNSPSWSPDGSTLAFVAGGEIWLIGADGSNQRQLTNSGAFSFDPTWSPDGTKILFSRAGSLATINTDGTQETPIPSSSLTTGASWSSDGSKIVLGSGGIVTMNPDGTGRVTIRPNIINFPLCCDLLFEHPAWQPVGQTPNTFSIGGTIRYNNVPVAGQVVNLSGTASGTTTTDASGSYSFSGLSSGGNFTVTPATPNYVYAPANRSFNALSANGFANFDVAAVCIGAKCVKNGKIAYDGGGNIFTVNQDGSGLAQITTGGGNSAPSYSPDGAFIVFSSYRDNNYEIFRMNGDGGSVARLTNNAAYDYAPSYSPDGLSITFISNRDGMYDVYKMNVDGSNVVRLTNDVDQQSWPSFSPDGTKIIFVTIPPSGPGTRLNIMNADGSNRVVLPDPGSIQPFYERPTFSPDGTKILFSYTPDSQSQPRSAWTADLDGTNRVRVLNGYGWGVFSPDGTRIASTCCIVTLQNTLRVSSASGVEERNFTNTSTASTPTWQPILMNRRTDFDYDGDGLADGSVFRASENKWYILRSSNAGVTQSVFAIPGDVPVPSDYDGDGKTDIAIFRPSSGDWWYLSSITGAQIFCHWGQSGDIPRPSDFDRDGKSDYVLYRPSNGVWYRYGSTGATSILAFGASGDQPVIGDFDGDGMSDPAVFRPSTGDWWYSASSSGSQHRVLHWGQTGDIPAPGDFDGDGKTDFAVFRPSNGAWYIFQSSAPFIITQFGLSGDRPVPADFDGDGRTDIAVFRPSTGVWYALQSRNGFGAFQWGIATDIALQNAFIP